MLQIMLLLVDYWNESFKNYFDLDNDGKDGNDNEYRRNTKNGSENFSMIEIPSWVQCEEIEEFMSKTSTWMHSISS